MGDKMPSLERQDIQSVNNKAEQLNALMQTIFNHHEDLDKNQLHSILGLAFDLSCSIYSWTEAEEKIVLEIEDAQRERK
ncbi:hypothetical protein ACT5AM_001601 [Cronobacter malonaticus]